MNSAGLGNDHANQTAGAAGVATHGVREIVGCQRGRLDRFTGDKTDDALERQVDVRFRRIHFCRLVSFFLGFEMRLKAGSSATEKKPSEPVVPERPDMVSTTRTFGRLPAPGSLTRPAIAKVPGSVAMTVSDAPRDRYVNEIDVAPKSTTVKRPLGLMVTTLGSPHCHLPFLVTSFVVLSLRVAVAVSCEVSPTRVSVRLPLIARRVTVAEGVVGVDFSPPQFVHVGARRISSTTPSLLLEYRIVLMDDG